MRRKLARITFTILLVGGVVSLGLGLVSRFRRPQLADVRRDEILRCLDEAQAIKVPFYGDYIVARSGDPGFRECIRFFLPASCAQCARV
jgi:hypothetical protein